MNRHIYFAKQPPLPRTFVKSSIRNAMADPVPALLGYTVDGINKNTWIHLHESIRVPVTTILSDIADAFSDGRVRAL